MAKIKKDSIRDKAVDQIITAWDQCSKQFYAAIKANDKQRGQVVFAVTIDKSDALPAVATKVSFKDQTDDGDLKVNKTFSKIIGGKVDEDEQETLPLDGDGKRPSRLFDEEKKKAPKKEKKPAKPKAKKKKDKPAETPADQETKTVTE